MEIIKKIIILITIISFIGLFLLACGVGERQDKTEIRVMAAASLTEVYNELKEEFEREYPEIKVEMNYAASHTLANQITSGVSADIFASANLDYMEDLVEESLVDDFDTFAYNELAIAVSKQVEGIERLEDLISSDYRLVVVDQSAPIGRYTREVLARIDSSEEFYDNYSNKILESVVSQELEVKSAVAKVELGEVDAGIVYRTDIKAADEKKVDILEIPADYNLLANYPVAILAGINQDRREASEKFLDYLYSEAGRAILEKYGFLTEN